MSRFAVFLVLALAAPFAGPAPANAQGEPSDAEKQKLRLDCRSDYIQYCSDIKPGGPEALNCLEAHMTSLSTACQADLKQIEIEMKGSGS